MRNYGFTQLHYYHHFTFINPGFHVNLLPQYLWWDLFLLIWEVYSIISCAWDRHLNSFYTHNVFQKAFKIGQMTHTTKICTCLQRLKWILRISSDISFTMLEKSQLCILKFYNLQWPLSLTALNNYVTITNCQVIKYPLLQMVYVLKRRDS